MFTQRFDLFDLFVAVFAVAFAALAFAVGLRTAHRQEIATITAAGAQRTAELQKEVNTLKDEVETQRRIIEQMQTALWGAASHFQGGATTTVNTGGGSAIVGSTAGRDNNAASAARKE